MMTSRWACAGGGGADPHAATCTAAPITAAKPVQLRRIRLAHRRIVLRAVPGTFTLHGPNRYCGHRRGALGPDADRRVREPTAGPGSMDRGPRPGAAGPGGRGPPGHARDG